MKLKDFYYSLSQEERIKYANEVGVSKEYIRVHLIPENRTPDRTPRKGRFSRFAEASKDKVSLQEVLEHFLDTESTTVAA